VTDLSWFELVPESMPFRVILTLGQSSQAEKGHDFNWDEQNLIGIGWSAESSQKWSPVASSLL
jgi:hypothetical protein